MANGDDVGVVGEDLVRDRVDQVALAVAEAGAGGVGLGVARKVELDEVTRMQGLAVDGVLARVLVEPGADDLDVEDGAVGGADGVLEGLEARGAEVEGQAAEGRAVGGAARGVGADAGRVGVRGGPLGVGDLW